MKLTQFTDNALRCLVFLAAAPTRTATVQQVSEGMRMSPDHLLKVIRRLVELGYVRTIRGRKGGVQLAKNAATITVADIVRATEDNLTLVPCFDPAFIDCPILKTCILAPAMDESLRAFFAVLERYTIADVAAETPSRLLARSSPVSHATAPNEIPSSQIWSCRRPQMSR